MRKFTQVKIPFLQREIIRARAKFQGTQASLLVLQEKIDVFRKKLMQDQANVPFLKRRIVGLRGQSVLQAGVAASCFVVFVGLPMLANEVRADKKDLDSEYYNAKGKLHKDMFEHELMMRKRAIAGTLYASHE